MNRKVTINIKDVSTIINKEYKIEIYCNNELIETTYTCDSYSFIANTNNIYTIKVFNGKEYKIGVIKYNNDLNIVFGCLNINNGRIRVLLTDYYYEGLKIESGNLKLWPNHIM